MNTRLLMIASALFTGLLGVTTSFLPQEILAYFQAAPDDANVLVLQLAGALYLGFSMLNWMARANLIGGIYSRPVTMGNFLHFAVGAVVLLRASMGEPTVFLLWILSGTYVIFAACFGIVLFTHPLRDDTTPSSSQPHTSARS